LGSCGFKRRAKALAMSSEFAIRVQNVGKSFHMYAKPQHRLRQMLGATKRQLYREFWAVRGVSFDVRRGETVGIVGCNGSGKSTLLQVICGTLAPTEGQVDTKGRLAALLELGAGFNPEFSGRENVYMNAAILGLSRFETDEKFDEIAEFADIGEFIDQPVKTYSSGMYVRLAFAVQACIDPDILVVDEALAVGDERFQRKCFARMERLKGNGTSILFVSHSAQNILDWCDRAILMHKGEAIYSDSPVNTIQAYQKVIYAPPDQQLEALAQVKAFRLATMEVKTIEVAASSADERPPQLDAVFFDPALVPETTVTYPTQGAEIKEILIQDLTGQRVNVLARGSEYVFVVKGKFLEQCRAVHFAIHICLISGVGVTGQRYPGTGRSIDEVSANSHFEIKFKFRLSLAPGTYFVGGGIWSDFEPECLHRVLDKAMIKVLPVEHNEAFGYFDATCGRTELVLE
jgi:lipopolysaccharide transport system ATP-binding protein